MSTEPPRTNTNVTRNKVPPKQRALIFQGPVALGAYETGVFDTLYKRILENDRQENPKRKQLFDIVAGTSAGAVNAAIIVSYVKKYGSWEGANMALLDFWKFISVPTPPLAHFTAPWLEFDEAARRYYSAKQFFYTGVENVFSRPQMILDSRFFDNNSAYPPTNTWFLYSNEPLKASLQKFVQFPIATSYDRKEPRLLMVTVDVEDGETVTFDSYSNKAEYGSSKTVKRTIRYDSGLESEHVMASGSFLVWFKYQEISGRRFWDGGLLSNTPLREVVQAHRDYWLGRNEDGVPDLDVYIVDVWQPRQTQAPADYDGVNDRKNDIVYSDKTEYDVKIASMVTDYVTLVSKLKTLAEMKGATTKEINDIFGSEVERSRKRSGEKRKYSDLIKGRFKIDEVVRIQRENDPYTISNKWADYTRETIQQLVAAGQKDAEKALIL